MIDEISLHASDYMHYIPDFEPCMTDIYLHIDPRMVDYMATHPIYIW